MPNLYGKQEDEQERDEAEAPAGQTPAPGQAAPGVTAPPPQEQGGFVNLEDIFRLNQGKAKEMADRATGQVEGVTKGLRGAAVDPEVKGAAYNTPYQGGGLGQTVAQPQANRTAGTQQPAQPQRKTKDEPAPAAQPAPTLAQRQQMAEGGPAGQRQPAASPGAFDGLLSPQQAQAAVDQQAQAAKQAQAQEQQTLGQYQKADEMLDAYASDEGQGLLEQVYGPGVTTYDTALMNQAGGRDEFAALSEQFRDYDDRYAREIAGNQIARDMEARDLRAQAAAAQAQAQATPSPLGDFGQPPAQQDSGVVGGGTAQELAAKAADYASKSTAGTQLGNRIIQVLSSISPENWGEMGNYPQGQLAEQIGSQYGLEPAQSLAYFKEFLKELPPEQAAWILGLVSGAGSEVGKGVLNMFGLGDLVHGLTTGANSSDDEWATFQQMFHEYLRAKTAPSDGPAAQGAQTEAQKTAAARGTASAKTGRA